MLAACVHHKIKFVCLSQCGFENAWIPDSEINEWQSTLHQCSAYFAVSRSSLRWAREHFAMELPSPRVVRNPVNVSYKPCLEWPESKSSGFTNMACVARLDLAAKGQDILLNVLASPKWQNREWRLNFYGDGPNKKAIDFLVRSLGLENRVKLHGRVGNVESIWKENQLLVMPSRFEGLPLALVEAQLCGRPAVLTPASGDCESVIDGVTAYLSESTASRHIDAALDRAWLDKANWQEIGQRAAKAIRSTVPEHPEIDFANLLIDIAGSEKL
jgi:glycosyltransferase involved in cell wall biosynthesis